MKLTVDAAGNWRLYTNTVPAGAVVLGTVTRDGTDTGALVRMGRPAHTCRSTQDAPRGLDGRTVAARSGRAADRHTDGRQARQRSPGRREP